jgi:hypothetical protein
MVVLLRFSRVCIWSLSMTLRFVAHLALFSALTSGLGCSAGGDGSKTIANGASSSSGGDGSTTLPNGGGTVLHMGGANSGLPMDPNDPRNVPVRQKTCDANGENCTCLRLALVGSLDSSSNTKDTKPFTDWLNGNSDGTARVTTVATKPPAIDAAFLANYDILLLANVNTWKFSADEKAAVATWVKEQGGGIVTLTGFASNATETADTSQLVDFAGMGYTGTSKAEWTAPDLPPGQIPPDPIYYKGGSVDMRNCLFRRVSMIDKDAGNTWAVKFAPQPAPLDKLTLSLDYVGAYIGWPVKAPPGSTVLATDPSSGKNIAVALEVEGKGRILSFGDEWVVLANLWRPVSAFVGGGGTGDMCYLAPVPPETETYHSVKSLYQSKQFWYDVINWVAPPSQCNFTIDDPDVIVK